MMNATDNYLRDVLRLLIERAKEAKSQRDDSRYSGDKAAMAFESGRATAYYEMVSTMLGQLSGFGLSRAVFGVPQDFEPDRDLL